MYKRKPLYRSNTWEDLDITVFNLVDPTQVVVLQSVCMPLRKMHDVVKVALVSLSLQEKAPAWELIVFADHDSITSADLEHWRPYLRQANCTRIVFIKDKRDNAICYLGFKWVYMFHKADPTSLTFILHAGDCYSDHDRLSKHWKNRHFDWQDYSEGHFYDVEKNILARFKKGGQTGLDMALRAEIGRQFSLVDSTNQISKAVDHWLYKKSQAALSYLDKKSPFLSINLGVKEVGLDLHGFNIISTERGKMLSRLEPPFYAPLPEYKLPSRLVVLIETGEI